MKTTLSLLLCLAYFCVNAQDIPATSRLHSTNASNESSLKAMMLSDVVTADNIASYKIEYELVDYSFPIGDSSILELISLQGMYARRKLNEDVVFHDLLNGVTIQLYSYKKALVRRKGVTDADMLKQ